MKLLANLDYQKDQWLGARAEIWDHPHELVDQIVHDYEFEALFRANANHLSARQLLAAEDFTAITNTWYAQTPRDLTVAAILDSPDWIAVTQAAAKFIQAFTPNSEQPA